MARLGKFFYINGTDNLSNAHFLRVRADGGITESLGCIDTAGTLLESASYFMRPSGYKEDTVYSLIPNNSNGSLSFTRASDAWRTEIGGLVQRTPWNLLPQSEDFTTVVWGKLGGTTVTANQATAPNGTNTADLITEGTSVLLYYTTLTPAGTYTQSWYLKKGTGDVAVIYFGSAYSARYNLTLGTIVSTNNATATITDVGNGWYRCTATATPTASFYAGLNYSNSSGLTIYAWGAQLVEGVDQLPYFPTTDRLNVPRLDYTYGTCPALLLEPQRTNLALSSDDLTNATYWTINSTRFTSATTTSILGANNAFIFTEAVALDSHNVFAASTNRPVSTSGATYTISAYFKQGTRRYAGISVGSGGNGIHIFLDTTTWAITDAKRFGTNTNWVYLSSQITSAPNSGGWYRLSVTFRTDASLTLIPSIFASNVSTSTSGEPVYLGDGSTIICGQIQLELGAYSTTYIPTTTASATRIADSFSRNNIYTNGLISASGGTWFVELKNNVPYLRDNGNALFIGDTTFGATNAFNISVVSGTQRLVIYKRVAGAFTSLRTTASDNVKIAIKWNGSTADVFENGVKVVSATAFPATLMEFLYGQQGVPVFIQAMALFNYPLSDADCQLITT